ncbi:hypothetical protein ACOME3_008154 [Neoechinorhynchus agilis]
MSSSSKLKRTLSFIFEMDRRALIISLLAIFSGTFVYLYLRKGRRTSSKSIDPFLICKNFCEQNADPVCRAQCAVQFDEFLGSQHEPNIDLRLENENRDGVEELMNILTGYDKLVDSMESFRNAQYDLDVLKELWPIVQRQAGIDSEFCEKSEHWVSIGFQGSDPYTDLRSMGMLGLHSIVKFKTMFSELFMDALDKLSDNRKFLSFGILAINVCYWQYLLLSNGYLKRVLYGIDDLTNRDHAITVYWRIYALIFKEFLDFWMKCDEACMIRFEEISKKFRNLVLEKRIMAYEFLAEHYATLVLCK